ncbi:hypothetical protein ACQSSU_20335 [Micromonospora echinospora]
MRNTTAYIRRTYRFPVRPTSGLDTPEGVEAVRDKLTATSAGYRAATTDPWSLIPNTGDDIPF